MDAELEEEEMEMTDMEPEGNVVIPGLDMEGQEPPPQVVDINDTNIPQDPSLITKELPAEPYGRTQVSTQTTEGPCRSTRVRFQLDTYDPIMS